MSTFHAELSDGRTVELESDHEPSEQEVLGALSSYTQTQQPKADLPGTLGSLGQSMGEYSKVAPPETFPALTPSLMPGIGGNFNIGGTTTPMPSIPEGLLAQTRTMPQMQMSNRDLTRQYEKQERVPEFQKQLEQVNTTFDAMLSAIPEDNIPKRTEIANAKAQAIQDINMRSGVAGVPFSAMGAGTAEGEPRLAGERLNAEDYQKLVNSENFAVGKKQAEVLAGLHNVGGDFVEMFKDPMVLAGMGFGKAAPEMSTVVGRAFGLQMLSSVPGQTANLYKAWKSGKLTDTVEAAGNLALAAGLGAKLATLKDTRGFSFEPPLPKMVGARELNPDAPGATPTQQWLSERLESLKGNRKVTYVEPGSFGLNYARWDPVTQEIQIDLQGLESQINESARSQKQVNRIIDAVVNEEVFHSVVPESQAKRWWRNSTDIEQQQVVDMYYGKGKKTVAELNAELGPDRVAARMGYEGVRIAQSRLARVEITELAIAKDLNRWLGAKKANLLVNIMQDVRSRIGTKSSRIQKLILERVSRNADLLQAAEAGEAPFASASERNKPDPKKEEQLNFALGITPTEPGKKPYEPPLFGPSQKKAQEPFLPGMGKTGALPAGAGIPQVPGPGPEAIFGPEYSKFGQKAHQGEIWKQTPEGMALGPKWTELRRQVSGEAEAARTEPFAISPDVKNFVDAMADPKRVVKNTSDNPTVVTTKAVGMAVRSLQDLDAILKSSIAVTKKSSGFRDRMRAGEKLTPEELNEYSFHATRRAFPREVVEMATNTGSWSQEVGRNEFGPRPLDWRQHPEVASWLKEHARELDLDLPDELKPPQQEMAYAPSTRKALEKDIGEIEEEIKRLRAIGKDDVAEEMTENTLNPLYTKLDIMDIEVQLDKVHPNWRDMYSMDWSGLPKFVQKLMYRLQELEWENLKYEPLITKTPTYDKSTGEWATKIDADPEAVDNVKTLLNKLNALEREFHGIYKKYTGKDVSGPVYKGKGEIETSQDDPLLDISDSGKVSIPAIHDQEAWVKKMVAAGIPRKLVEEWVVRYEKQTKRFENAWNSSFDEAKPAEPIPEIIKLYTGDEGWPRIGPGIKPNAPYRKEGTTGIKPDDKMFGLFVTNQSFQEWAGKSSVSDKDGNPILFHHGTPEKGISELRGPVFMTPKEGLSRSYTGLKELPKKPGWITSGFQRYGDTYSGFVKAERPLMWDKPGGVPVEEAKRIFSEGQHDLIINEKNDEIVVASPHQIWMVSRPTIERPYAPRRGKEPYDPKQLGMFPSTMTAKGIPGEITKPSEHVSPSEAGALPFRTPIEIEQQAKKIIEGPIKPGEYPSFDDFVAWGERNLPGIRTEQLTSMWEDAVWNELMAASPGRLAMWRHALGLEKVFGSRDIIEAQEYGFKLETETVVSSAAEGSGAAKASTDAKKMAIYYREQGDGMRAAQWEKRASDLGDIASERRAEARAVKAEEKKSTGTIEAKDRYRTRIITEIARKLLQDTMPKKETLDRNAIDIEDIDFDNPNTAYSAWMDIPSDVSPDKLDLVFRDEARRSSKDPVSVTKNLVVLMNKHNGNIEVVSAYPHGRSGIMATMPGVPRLVKRPNVPLKQLLKDHRAIYRILLKEPVQNFHQHFSSISDFNDRLGKVGNEMARAAQYSEFAGEPTPVAYEPWTERRRQRMPEEYSGVSDAPEGLRAEDIALEWFDPPESQVVRGEGGSVTGEEADVARAEMGIEKRPGAVRTFKPMTSTEANALRDTILGDVGKVESMADMAEAMSELARRKKTWEAEMMKRPEMRIVRTRRLSAKDWAAIAALHKATREMAKRNPDLTSQEIADKVLDAIYENITKSKDAEEYTKRTLGQFGRAVRVAEGGGPGARKVVRGVIRDVTTGRAVPPTVARPSQTPPGVWPNITTRPPRPVQPTPRPAESKYLSPEEQAALAAQKSPETAEFEALQRQRSMLAAARNQTVAELMKLRKYQKMPYRDLVRSLKSTESWVRAAQSGRETPYASARDMAEATGKRVKEWFRTAAITTPEAVLPDTRRPIPRFIDNVDTQLTRAMGIERIPLLGKMFGPRANVRDEVDRAVIGYSVKRNIGRAQSAIIGAKLEAFNQELGNPFKQDNNGMITNLSADRGVSLYPSDVFEDWQRQFVIPQKMRSNPAFTESDVAEYEAKNPKRMALTEEQLEYFNELYRHLEDGYKYIEEKNSKLEYYGGISRETRAAQQIMAGLPKGLEIYLFPRIALYKRSTGPVMTEIRRRIGGQYDVEQERLYKTEEQGQKTTVYEPDMSKRMISFIDRVYKAVADADLARNEALKGKTPGERVEMLSREYEAELRSGLMSQKDIIELSKQARLGQEAFVEGHAGFTGKIYPIDIANRLERAFGEQSHAWIRIASEFSTLSKAFMLTGDLAQYFQQGSVMMYRRPQTWLKATLGSLRSIANPMVVGKYLQQPENYKAATEFIQAGGSLGRLQDFMAGANVGEVATKIPVFRQLVVRSGHAFGTYFDLSKIEMWKALKDTAPRDQWPELVEMIENINLSGKMEAAGIHPGRATGERILFMATAYYRGALQLIAGMADRGVAGKEARKALGSFATGVTLTMVGLYLANGMSWDEIRRRLVPGSGNRGFLRYPVKIGNRTVEIGPGGIILGISGLMADITETAMNRPRNLVKFGPDNPMIRFLSSKLGPLPGLLTELRTGVDFTGRPSSPIMAVGRMVQPIAVQQLIQAAARERKSPAMARAGAGFFGLQASITSPETQVRELAIDYIKANDLEKPSGWKLVQTEDPSYSKLRTALGNNNVREARQILDDLVKIHKNSYNEVAKAMDQWGKMNFVGRENENDFYDSLTNKQKSVYDQAEAERFEIIDKFYELPVNPSWD